MSDLAICIQGVNKRFGRTHAVRDLDLDVPKGSLCGFLGPNGAGKSTTIRMIMSIIHPDKGSIDVLGGSALDRKDRIGYLPEERGLYRKMRVGEFLAYIAHLKGMRGRRVSHHVGQWLERLDLPGVSGRRCQELSKGMQQKVQFLAAILHEPDLVILDEPFSGLDPMNAELLNRLIRGLRDEGRTVIFSTHVLHQAEQICDRIFLINHGVKLLDASMAEIHERFDPRTIVAEPLNGAAELSPMTGVRSVSRLSGSPALELELEEGFEPQVVMRDILDTTPVRSVELRRPTLNEVFVRLVRQGEGAEAAALVKEQLSDA